jgi:hypothetical protein
VDNDPVVLSHAKALLASGPEGATAYVDADLRDPETILAAAMAEIADTMNELVAEKVTFRTQAEVLRFFDGFELVEPGVMPVPQWRPASDLEAASPTVMWCGSDARTDRPAPGVCLRPRSCAGSSLP